MHRRDICKWNMSHAFLPGSLCTDPLQAEHLKAAGVELVQPPWVRSGSCTKAHFRINSFSTQRLLPCSSVHTSLLNTYLVLWTPDTIGWGDPEFSGEKAGRGLCLAFTEQISWRGRRSESNTTSGTHHCETKG